MEDDDLLEISGEDDSLLLQIPSDDVSCSNVSISNSNRTYFTCSPLQMPRSKAASYHSIVSPIESLMGANNAKSLNSSAVRDSSNKENISGNKPEVLKLSMEPQQMKRKKKGGGYNLRKSLAWDRAFFTEEGVLDRLELSMISGNINQSGGERLSVIHEEKSELLLGLDCTSEPADLQALEENLFKELPVSTRNEEKNVANGLLSQNDLSARDNVAPASLAKRKVLSAHDDNSSRSKRSGHSHPVVSPSLKRPSSLSTRNAPNKESKVSKVPVPKTNPSFLPKTAKRATQAISKSKQNQTTKIVNVQKSTGLTSSSNYSRNARNDVKTNLAPKRLIPKSTLQHASKKVTSASEAHSSTISQHLPDPRKNKGFKNSSGPAPNHALNGCDADSSNNAVSFPQSACSTGRSMQCSPASLQTVKPSGLRMPSPSLGLFSLSKSSTSDIPLQRSTPPCNLLQPNIVDLRKPSVLNPYNKKPPFAPKNLPETAMTTGFVKTLGSSVGCSNQSSVYTALHGKMKLKSENNIREVEAPMPYPKNQTINNQQQSHAIPDAGKWLLDHAEPCKIQNFSCVASQTNENKLVPSGEQKRDDDNRATDDVNTKQNGLRGADDVNSASHIKPAMEVKSISGSNGLTTDQLIEGKECNFSFENRDVSSELKFSDGHSYDPCDSFKSEETVLGCKFLVNDLCQEQQSILKPSNFEEHVVGVDSQRIDVKNGFPIKNSDFLEDVEKVNKMDIQEQVFGAVELEISDGSSYSEVKQKAEDIGLQSLDATTSLECESNVKKASILDDQCLPCFDDTAEDSEENGFSSERFRVTFVASKGANKSESRSSTALCLMPQALQECGEKVDCLQVENRVLGSTSAELGPELDVNGQATSESERTSKDEISAAGLAFEVDIPKIVANEGESNSSAALWLMPLATEDSGETVDIQYMDDPVSGSDNPLYPQDAVPAVEATSLVLDDRDQITSIGTAPKIDITNAFPTSRDLRASSSVLDGGDQISDIGMASEIDITNAFPNRGELSAEMVEYHQMEAHFWSLTHVQRGEGFEVHGQPLSSESERVSKDKTTGTGDSTEIDIDNVMARANGNELENSVTPPLIPQAMQDTAEMAEIDITNAFPTSRELRASSSVLDGGDQITDIGMASEIDITNAFPNRGELSSEMVECHQMEVHLWPLTHAQRGEGFEFHGQPLSSESERVSKDKTTGTGDSTEIDIDNVMARANGNELENSVTLPLIPQAMQDGAEMAKSHHMGDHEWDSSDAQCGQEIEVHGQPTSESKSASKYQGTGTQISSEQDIRILVEATSSVSDGRYQISDVGMASEINMTNAFPNSEDLTAEMVECHHMETHVKGINNSRARATENELKGSSPLCLMPLAVHEWSDMECYHIEDDHVSGSTNAKYEQDMVLPMESTSSKPEGNDQITGKGLASEIDIISVSLDNGEFHAGYSEDMYSGAVLISTGKHDNVLTENRDMKDKKCHLLVKNHCTISDLQTAEAVHHTDPLVLDVHNICSSCKHNVHKESMEKTRLTESCFVEGEKTSQLKKPSPNTIYGCLFEGQSPAGASLKVEGSPEWGMRSQLECTEQENDDCSGSILKEKFQTSDDSCTSVPSNISAGVTEQVSRGRHVESPASIVFHEESQKKDAIGTDCDMSEQPYVSQSESNSLSSCILREPVTENEGVNVLENIVYSPKFNSGPSFIEIEMSVENLKCQVDMRSAHDRQLTGQGACSEFDSSLTGEAQVSPPLNNSKSKTVCSLNEESGSSVEPIQTLSNDNSLQHAELDIPNSVVLLEEAEADVSQNGGGPKSEMQHEFCHGIPTSKEKDAIISIGKGTADNKKPDALVIKPPPHAAPFSDEWLAAFEAAGEEILTLKSGAVQNSPPQQSLPEPGPWSPVKRKNHQDIGPFDCTKFTSTNTSPGFD